MAAWAIQALARDYDVTLALLGPMDVQGLNRSFGTSLSESDFQQRLASGKYKRLLRCMPTQGALFESNLTSAWARELDSQEHFTALLCTQNEADFGRTGVQYIHYPSWYLPRPDVEMKWFHRIPGLLALYRSICFRCGGTTHAGIRRNISLANSEFVAGRIRDIHGGNPRVLAPPVPGDFPAVAWEKRRAAFVGVEPGSPAISAGAWRSKSSTACGNGGHDIGFDALIGQIGHSDRCA